MERFKLLRHILHIAMSVCAIAVNLYFVKTKAWCNYVYLEKYADDVYTGIQNTTAMTANNLWYLSHYFEGCVRWASIILCIVFGMIILKNIEAAIVIVNERNNNRWK